MIDWLRREHQSPTISLGDHSLPIAILRHARARRMTLRLAPDGSEVRVTLPQWGRTADAIAFARSRADWLTEQLARIPSAQPPVPGGALAYRGECLRIMWLPSLSRTPRIAGTELHVGGPHDGLGPRLRRWMERQALDLMQQDLEFYCHRADIAAPGLRLSRERRRWGSCAGDGTIRLNWRLVQAPDAIRRSVVAHEVAHLIHFDHSPAFHALLGAIFDDDIRAANAWLKQHGPSLYSTFG